jgi:hypothetical protein
MKSLLINFLSSKTNESIKRVIAFIFSISLVIDLFLEKDLLLQKIIIIGMFSLICLLLALATAETIVGIFKKDI